jgi:HEAT repeat protein
LGKARQTVARDLKAAVAAGRITVFDLQAAILDPTIPVEARIIAAEAIMGLLPDQVSALDVVALSQILIGAESPLLSTRLIELLGMTRNPACLAAIQTKAAVPAENIRLAAVAAAVGFNDPLASRFLEKCAQDAEFYRVRIQAIHAIAHDPNQTNAIAVIRNALEVERSRTPASTPAGQSPDLNRQLLTVAAARAMSGKSDPATVSFLSEQLGDPETPLPARKAAADALGETRNPTGVGPLLTALDDTDEGLRMHAARALKNGFGAAYDENIRRSLSHCRDPYAVQQITQILESKR